jgi:hypothetical protein
LLFLQNIDFFLPVFPSVTELPESVNLTFNSLLYSS